MKKLLISIAILLLIGAGYFTYEKWVKHANLTNWSFVPADAAMVFEAEVIQDLSTLQQYSIWSTIEQSSGFDNLRNGLSFLDSINGEGGFSAIFEKAPTLASLHKVSNSNVDFLFIVELQNISQNTFANATIGKLQKAGYRFRTRNYNDFKISEISNNGKTLTFIFYKNFFLASFTPYLVEDAIRAISDTELASFREKFTRLSETGVQGMASIYVNYAKASEAIGAFTSGNVKIPMLSGNYEVMLDSTFIQLSGFSYTKDGWLGTHTTQPATFDMAEVVPENTAYFFHITSTEISKWKEQQIQYLRSTDPKIRNYQDSLKALYDFNADQVFDLIDNEIGVANLESPRSRDEQKLMILEVKDIQESLDFFSQLTQRISIARGDSVYTESYSDNEIRFLPIANFPSTILGNLADGFDQCFYISYRNYLIFSNDLQELKNLISSVQNEDTWGKSIQMNNFLERANNAANVSLFVNIPRAWTNILNTLKPEWEEHFRKNTNAYKSFELAAFQFSYLDGRFFTNYTFTQPVKRAKSIPKTSAENGVRFVSKLTSKPYLLRTHAHRDFDILLQDSSNTVYYLDPNQNALWSEPVEEAIVGDVYPIDYYKNGKLQYVFATASKVHIIDRTGEYIPGYPKTLPGSAQIEHLNLIDYDLSRNYRMAITSTEGNIYLTDKDMKILDGWNPRKLNRKALTPLNHARLGRKDAMISIQENGIINLMSRRGDFMKGFPFDTRQTLSKQYFLRQSNGLGNSSITVISNGGEITELNLEGDVVKRDQLIKTSADARFRLVPDTGEDSFIIIRNEGNTYEVLDDTGNLLFKKDYLSEGPILIQYYQFGAGKDLVIFTDKANKSLYIYDKSGNLLTGNPLNSEHEVSLIYSAAKREFQVFSTWGSNLELYTFSY
ncbi:MAG: DUF3352 domain-containing protein [Ekhidna sp.]|uniref:DUF3352 domain-containing protein n=1 Tax=Ekhidna sp. TaxID=2608089 RepID=UPI0032EF256C